MPEGIGIERVEGDTRPRCTSGVAIGGLSFRCDYVVEHEGWAHSSKAAKALWQDGIVWGEDLATDQEVGR